MNCLSPTRTGHNHAANGLVVTLVSLTLAATVAFAMSGCGGAGDTQGKVQQTTTEQTGAAKQATAQGSYSLRDGDRDSDDEHPPLRFGNDDAPLLVDYGGRADPANTHTIEALVRSYYAASLAGNGAKACELLARSLAQAVPDEYGKGAQAGGEGCRGPMSTLLAQQHARLLSQEIPTMLITGVHVKGKVGLAVLRFKTTPESQIILAREGGIWKINALFGAYMP
jgi:hypothetical protein